MTSGPFITFASVARQVAARGWRPFPGHQSTKVPAMPGWSGLNSCEWDEADLAATIADYWPADNYACCLAVQAAIVVIDADIVDPEHAAYTNKLADEILGETPLMRIGMQPKCVRIYRAGDSIKSRKLHPIEIFSGSGQFVGYGWHAKANRPYLWPHESPLSLRVDSPDIPPVVRSQLDRFTTELFKVVPRRLLPTRQGRPGTGNQSIGERLRMLTALHHGSWKRAAAIVLSEAACEGCEHLSCSAKLSEACEGYFNDTLWTIVTSAAGHGIPEDVIWEVVEKNFSTNPTVSEIKVIASMIERTRPKPRQTSMIFSNKKVIEND
jgi:hypothetical protein